MPGPSRRVTSTDGVRLAVHETGAPSLPTLVAVHGYPNNHSLWDELAALLSDRFHVVSYDVRGCGDSDKPERRSAYRIPQLVDDLATVVDAVSPDEPVDLLAHDWGSIQSWPAVTGDRLAGRIATYTSISGPSLDYSAAWLRRLRDHPRPALRQLAHSYYVFGFQLPGVPELVVRSRAFDRAVSRGGSPAPELADKLNGLQLYRANMLRSMRSAAPAPCTIPVQVIVPSRDPFVGPDLAVDAARPWVADLTVQPVDAGHWIVHEQPELIAELVATFTGH